MSDSSFVPERQLAFSPMLAATIGREEAVLFHHLNELLAHRRARRREGRDWLQVERDWLERTLPFWSLGELLRVVRSLADKGMILMEPLRPDSPALVFALNGPGPVPSATPTAASPAKPTATPLAPGWAPSEDMLNFLEFSHGIPRAFALESLEDFVCYWRERGDACHAWDNKFRRHALNRWRAAEQTQAQGGRGGALSAPALDENWRPSANVLKLLEGSGISRAFINAAVPGFILYWQERNPQEKGLNAKFLEHVKYRWAHNSGDTSNDASNSKPQGTRRAGRRDRSVQHNLNDRSWAY